MYLVDDDLQAPTWEDHNEAKYDTASAIWKDILHVEANILQCLPKIYLIKWGIMQQC